jgi:hypothetical protein
MKENAKPIALKLLCVIVDRKQTKKVTDILCEERARFHFITLGEGTAGSDIMRFLGLDSIDKSLICCLEPDFMVLGLMKTISERLQLRKPGKGIAFITPISGVSNATLSLIVKDVELRGVEDKLEAVVKNAPKYDMILTVVNQGRVDDVMEAAKAAGARGGTVLHGRKVAVGEEAKFLGISVQLEKDIVAILTTRERKTEIMRAINQACGMNTEAQGVIVSLPVDEIEGLGSVKSEAGGEAAAP